MEKVNIIYDEAPVKGDWVLVYNYFDNEYGFDLTEKIETDQDNKLIFYGKFGTICSASLAIKLKVIYE